MGVLAKIAGFLVPAALAALTYRVRSWPLAHAANTVYLVARMKMNKDVPTFLRDTCWRLEAIAGSLPTKKDWFVDAGAVDVVVDAMKRYPDKKMLQVACSGAVSSMSLYSFRTQTYAGEIGAVELVVDMMNRWPMDPKCQKGGNSGCFMDFSEVNRGRFQKHGGIEAMLKAIENHFDNGDVVVQSWFGFSSGTQPPNTEPFVAAGGLDWAVKCMRGHPKSHRVREEIMQALRMPLQHNHTHRITLIEKGYVQDLVTAMNDAPLDYHQQSPACANLGMILNYNKTARVMAHKAGATEAALRAVIDFPKMKPTVGWAIEFDSQYTVYDDCLRVLVQLVNHCEAHKYLLEVNAADPIKNLLAKKRKPTLNTKVWDSSMAGWQSRDKIIVKYGQTVLDALEKPCVELDADKIYEWGWYHQA